jgi:hypothetical protein
MTNFKGGKRMLPQIVYLGLALLGLGIELERHGKPKEGEHNFGISLISTTITICILWWGGFFNPLFK